MTKNSVTTKSLLFFTAQVLLLAGLYFVAGLASFSLAVSHAVVTLVVFTAEGFALAAVILWGRQLWLGVFFGQLLLALYSGLTWYTALGISAINSLEAVIGAILFHRLGLQPAFTRMRDVLGLLLLIFFVLQPFSATLGVLSLWSSGVIPTEHLAISWFSWWFGNSLGQIIITPLVLSFLGDKQSIRQKLHRVAWLILLAIPIGFISLFSTFNNITIVFTLTIPLLILLAVKGGMALVTLATVILTTATLFFTRLQITASLAHDDITLLLDLNAHLLANVLVGQFVAALLTEYKQVQLAQQEASEHLQKIADNFPGVIFQYRLHPNGSSCFPYASVGIQDIYHVSPEEVKEDATKVSSVFHPEDHDRVASSIRASAQNLTTWQCDYRVRYEDGTVRWLSGHSVPQREKNGVVLWHGFIKDVTEVKQKEIEYQTVIEASFSGFFCTDILGRFLNANSAMCRMLGYTRQELLNMSVANVEAAETVDEIAIHVQAIVKAGHDNFETRYRCKDGNIIDIEINVLYSEALGRRFFVFASDISERKRMEEQVRESEYKFRQFIDKAPIPITFINNHGELEYVNERFEKLCGYSIQDVPTLESWWSLAYPDEHYRSWAQRTWGEAVATSLMEEVDIEPMEYNVTCKNGTVRVMIMSGIVFAEGLLAMLIDVTERKQMEVRLRKNHDELLRYFEQPFIGMLTASPDKQTLHVNQRFCDMVGYSKEEMQIINWGEVTHPDDMAVSQAYLEQAIRGEIDSFQMETRYVHKDGHIVYADVAVNCVRKANGQPDYFIAMLLDITARKQVEHYLQKNQVLLQTAQRAARLGHYVLDLHTVSWTNDMLFNEIFGITNYFNRNLTNWQQLIFPEDRQRVIEYFAQTIRSHEISPNIEYRIVRPSDGVIRWIADWGHIFYDDDNNPVQQVGMIQDITERKLAEQQLQKTTEQLQLVLEGGYLGFWDWNIVTGEVQRNTIWAEILGYRHEEIEHTAKQWEDFIYIDDRKKAWQSIHDVLEGRSPYHEIEYRMLHKDGSIRWVLDHASIVQRDASGKPTRMSGTHTDITKLKNLEEKLRESENFFSSLAQVSPVGIYQTNTIGDCIFVNQQWCEIAGISRKQALGSGWQTAVMVDDREKVMTEWATAVQEKRRFALEYRFQQPNGKTIWVYGQATVINDEKGRISGYVGTITDITERKVNEEYINRLAFYDPLTQLPNRRLLKERIKHGIEMDRRTGRHMAVLMMDLDKFKAVNDTLGHAAGDELLKQVAERIKVRLREIDTIARLGGDEFVILLENISHYQHIARIADAIIETLSQEFILYEIHKIYIGASIGIAIHPQHGDSEEELMDNADTALYYAKEHGRGRFAYFSEQLTEKARERIALESRLRLAIEQHEFRVYFQPQIDINTGCMVGAEALVRWHDPVRGCLMPCDFMELAEESGLIVELDEWTLQETCRLGRQWLDQQLPSVILSVNISNYQFCRGDVNALVAKILDDTHFPADHLELEITETALLDNQKNAQAILNTLHNQGVHLAIDDFGTGYSSLLCLKRFPVDLLKIGKIFIENITSPQDDSAIITTIIATAHNLGFKVLAESVETPEQLAFLKQQGCDMYQGRLYSQALSADAFAKNLFDIKKQPNNSLNLATTNVDE